MAALQGAAYVLAHINASPTELHDRVLGKTLISTLEDASNTIWIELLRMSKASFEALLEWLEARTPLRSGRHISVREKLIIFLYIVCQSNTHRMIAFLFGRSVDTINR